LHFPDNPQSRFIHSLTAMTILNATMAEPTTAEATTVAVVPPAATTTTVPLGNDVERIQRLSIQLKKLTEANNKYKNILKLARDRIQAHEEELTTLRSTNAQLQGQLEEKESALKKAATNAEGSKGKRKETIVPADAVTVISHVYQRVSVPPTSTAAHAASANASAAETEIWALIEFRTFSEESPQYNKKYKEWLSFHSESQLQDYIRRDTGEPLTLPPFSMTPDQSARIELEAEQRVSKVTEEFRRFRVKSELARKQAEAQIRELQSAKNQTVAQQLERGDDSHNNDSNGLGSAGGGAHRQLENNAIGGRAMQLQLERLKAEMATQEAYWKESYDTLLAENTALKQTGSEALLASQWRQRYETCKSEKQQLEQALQASTGVSGPNATTSPDDAEKYEQKYRDLKESFRLYRKKAKEIFEAQQQQNGGTGGGLSSAEAIHITSNSSSDAKLSYLKNLMINYLTADPAVRPHMETAIGTVLQFTNDEKKLVDSKKTAAAVANASWF
jgi:hypothetical protein